MHLNNSFNLISNDTKGWKIIGSNCMWFSYELPASLILKRDLKDFPGLISSQIICLQFVRCCGVRADEMMEGKFCMPLQNLFSLTFGNYQPIFFEPGGHLMVICYLFLLTSPTCLSTFSSSLVSQNQCSKEDGTKCLPSPRSW